MVSVIFNNLPALEGCNATESAGKIIERRAGYNTPQKIFKTENERRKPSVFSLLHLPYNS